MERSFESRGYLGVEAWMREAKRHRHDRSEGDQELVADRTVRLHRRFRRSRPVTVFATSAGPASRYSERAPINADSLGVE